MAFAVLRQIKGALSSLNPGAVREDADRTVRICLVTASPEMLGRMETFFAPPHFSMERRAEAVRLLVRGPALGCDLEVYDSSLLRPSKGFALDLEAPDDCIRRILKRREDLMLPLARHLYPFRKPAAHKIIRAVAKENAMFSLATAIPDIIPSLASIPWAIGEFSSDTAFLTMNQIRMAFQLAAVSDRPIGYREQKSEVASIIAGAFGWRALARELVGKVPFGGGLIPKAGIAYAATYAVGLSLERLYRLGYGFTRDERRAVYEEAFLHGKQIAGMLLDSVRHRKAV
ncbi:MAG TPA: hypothetical protein VNU44_09425 [Bryobacteraceae bacterium]|jgi:hypothetical protein|nr:hypothetical protein [Bryobacteraceae bacterium]